MDPKHILLLYKKSTFQYYQQIPKDFRPDDREVDRFKQTHRAHYETVANVERILTGLQLPFDKVERGRVFDYTPYDLIITVGGDGTFLEGARYIHDQIILGVNSDPKWSVGRLCFANNENFQDYIHRMLEPDFQPVFMNRMKAVLQRAEKTVYFINDLLIAHANPASLSRYILQVDDYCEEQRSSGVWVSTSAGSTGGIFSAGGEVLDWTSDEFQYLPRELYQGWEHEEYQLLGGVLKEPSRIRISSLMAEGMIFVDGSHQRIVFAAPEQVEITQAELPLKLVGQLPAKNS